MYRRHPIRSGQDRASNAASWMLVSVVAVSAAGCGGAGSATSTAPVSARSTSDRVAASPSSAERSAILSIAAPDKDSLDDAHLLQVRSALDESDADRISLVLDGDPGSGGATLEQGESLTRAVTRIQQLSEALDKPGAEKPVLTAVSAIEVWRVNEREIEKMEALVAADPRLRLKIVASPGG